MYQYYNDVLNNTTLHQPLNEYELTMVLDLLRKGHAKAEEKTHGGVKFISVGVHSEWKSRCFMVHHEDGSKIDFSYRKYVPCLAPEESCLAVQCSAVHACGAAGEDGDGQYLVARARPAAHGTPAQGPSAAMHTCCYRARDVVLVEQVPARQSR